MASISRYTTIFLKLVLSVAQVTTISAISLELDVTSINVKQWQMHKLVVDYCNALLNSIFEYDLERLNSIQYSLCRIIQRTSRFSREYMSPHLRSLHWPPVKQRIRFKWCLLILKILKLGLPPYFSPYFVLYTSKISTGRSTPSKNMLSSRSPDGRALSGPEVY